MNLQEPASRLNLETKPLKSNKEMKKFLKFIKKGIHKLNEDNKKTNPRNEFNSCKISKVIFIVNGGLTTGADNVQIMEFFISSGYKGIEKVIMIPGKQYSFVVFIDPHEAEKAVETLSGVKCLAPNKHPLYMTCINRAPLMQIESRSERPPGLLLIHDFISDGEEHQLSELINWSDEPNCGEGSTLKHRQVRHFGYEFQYSSNSIDKLKPLKQNIPEELLPICQRLVDDRLMLQFPDQLTVNRYLPGQGIPPHIDTHSPFTGEIVSLSILGSITMDFRCEQDDSNSPEKSHCEVNLPRKSLCVMTGPARYLWTHGICPRKTDVISSAQEPGRLTLRQRTERISFTFRKLRTGDCNCQFPSKCDSQLYGKKENTTNRTPVPSLVPSELEKEHVLNVYDNIADHFSCTRHKPWPKVLDFVQRLPPGSFLLDVGCGNGKYLGHNKSIYELGSDTCSKLLTICQEREFAVCLSNCVCLPFRDGVFDSVICIAVIHHLASQDRRKKAVSEIVRVLRRGGTGLIYVWAMEQRKGKMSSYLKQKRSNRAEERDGCAVIPVAGEKETNKALFGNNVDSSCDNEEKMLEKLSVHENRTDFVEQDLFVPWKVKPERFRVKSNESRDDSVSDEAIPVYHRYYHVFREGELEQLLSHFQSLEIKNSYYDEGNWCASFRKL